MPWASYRGVSIGDSGVLKSTKRCASWSWWREVPMGHLKTIYPSILHAVGKGTAMIALGAHVVRMSRVDSERGDTPSRLFIMVDNRMLSMLGLGVRRQRSSREGCEGQSRTTRRSAFYYQADFPYLPLTTAIDGHDVCCICGTGTGGCCGPSRRC